jgi:hypothetical protein
MGFKISPDITYKKIVSEHFLFDRKTGFLHSFNDCGTLIMDLLIQGRPENEIVDELTSSYEISRDQAEKDFQEFISELVEKKLITQLEE